MTDKEQRRRSKKAGEGETPGIGKAASGANNASASEEKAREEAADEKMKDEDVSREAEGKMSEEEFRRLIEESLEKVTVAEVALTMMNQLASMGYLKMGLPESVNLKYRDLEQASLAIDLLEAMIKGGEGKMAEDQLRPFRGTLANLQMNFVRLRQP